MDKHLIKFDNTQHITMDITPESAEWDYLAYRMVKLGAGETYTHKTGNTELALVPQSGSAELSVGDDTFNVSRSSVFEELPHVLYVPPQQALTVTANDAFEFAIGTAPAEGKYPVRLFTPDDIKVEIRGGGAATRQVNHILSHPMPAERLILFEVYVPGGAWSGYPPHCHDGYGDSAYLEETYYFRFNPANGFGFHRNYRVDTDFDETFTVHDKECVLVTQGFHSTTAAPGATIYFLNYLAGELLDDERGTPPYDDPQYAHLRGNLDDSSEPLPIVGEAT